MPRRKNKHPNSFAGRGMKPRGNAEEPKVESTQTEKPVDPMKTGKSRCNCWCNGDPFKAPEQHAVGCPESLESRRKEKDVSTDQVQPEVVNGVIDGQYPEVETPPSQEAETGGNDKNAIRPGSMLAEMLKQSGEKPPDDANVKPNLAKKPDPAHEPIKPPAEGFDRMPEPPTDADLRAHRGKLQFIPAGIGLLPNGDFGVVITIPESYVTSVKDFAEADGRKTVEQWSSEFFVMHLEAYCTPLKGR